MGQFKPMVKMMTNEPSVILKLKKGGMVAHKATGGYMPMASTQGAAMPARGGMAPSVAPMKPSMAMRRRAMNPTMMKKGGKADDMSQDKAMIKKAFKQHDMQEHMGDKGTSLKLKKGGMMTGGVKMGNGGGYAKGGNVNWENRPADTAKPGKVNTTTGGVKNGNGGGYKMGGSTKKAFATGGQVVDDGKAEKMPRHAISRPVANSLQSGTFKKGGMVGKYAEGGQEDEPPRSARQLYAQTYAKHGKTIGQSKGAEAKAYEAVNKKHGDEVLKKLQAFHKKNENGYAHGGMAKKFNDGGSSNDKYIVKDPKAVSDKASRELEEAMNPLSMVKELYGKAKNLISPPAGSVTKTEKSVTVAPGRKRGGSAMC
jgi:hypothetical protein